MVEFKCLGHDSRKQHACRSLCWRRGGGFYVGRKGSFFPLGCSTGKKEPIFPSYMLIA